MSRFINFFHKGYEDILAGFNKVIADLEKLEQRLLDKAKTKEYLAITLKNEVHDHQTEAQKARQTAAKLRSLVG